MTLACLEVLQKLKTKGPRFYIVTRKGKGWPAEDKQITYHAPGKFDPYASSILHPNKIR